MIIIDYNTGETLQDKLWQYDYGETLRIQGGNLQKAQEVHFSLNGTGGTTVTRIGATKDGVTDVVIPDSMLENNDSEIDYLIYVFLYNRDSTSGETTKRFVLNVRSRSKPEHTGGTDGNAFGEVVEEVRKSAERTEAAQAKAEKYATQTKADATQTALDREKVKEMVDTVSNISEQVETVKNYTAQAQEASTNALLSEQETKKAEQSALQAQAGAETAENSAEQHATQARGDKAEVERLSTQVREDKAYVEQTAQNFALKAQQTLADVNNAGQTQTERVQSAGTTAMENIQTAQNTATKGIETAKTEAVKMVQTEGTKQVQAVQEKGNEVLQSVPPDFATQMQGKLDKQQGVENAGKALVVGQDGNVIPSEVQSFSNDGIAIINTMSGKTSLLIPDSAERITKNFKLLGKSEQAGTPTPENPIEIKNIGKYNEDTGKYDIDVSITGKNLFDISTCENGKILNSNAEVINNENALLSDFIPCFENTEYCRTNVGFTVIAFYDYKKNKIGYINQFNNNFNTPSKCKYFRFSLNKSHTNFNIAMANVGNKLMEYEPYRKQQTFTLSLGQPLQGIEECKDSLMKNGIVRKIKRLILDGSEDWKIRVGATFENVLQCSVILENVNKEISGVKSLCDRFKNIGINADTEGYCNYFGLLYISLGKTKAKTVEEFKNWLSQNKTVVEYEILEPVIEELPEEIKQKISVLHSNYPTTIISNDENAEMEVEYVADTKNYIDNKLKELVTANMQNTANLLSLMPLSTQAEMIENDTNRILESEVTQ